MRNLRIPYHPRSAPLALRCLIGVTLILLAIGAIVFGEKVASSHREILIARGVALLLFFLGTTFLVHADTVFDFGARMIRRQRLLFGRYMITERNIRMELITGLKVVRCVGVGSDDGSSDTVWLYLMSHHGRGFVLGYYNVRSKHFANEPDEVVDAIVRAVDLPVDGRELLRGSR